ncbi:MAG: hypothetical protein M3391_08935 [Actinomycetota bacterium]|nr:hypothetical protein [Actinomycetota bacterium]
MKVRSLDQMGTTGLFAGLPRYDSADAGSGWLTALQDVSADEFLEDGSSSADLVLSTSGLSR